MQPTTYSTALFVRSAANGWMTLRRLDTRAAALRVSRLTQTKQVDPAQTKKRGSVWLECLNVACFRFPSSGKTMTDALAFRLCCWLVPASIAFVAIVETWG